MAQNDLGVAYEYGEGVPQDQAQAVMWYRKAAEQGEAMAQFNLGRAYRDGKGVPKDSKQAAEWFEKAAQQGYAHAQFDLGEMYFHGEGIPEDEQKGFEWLGKAERQGYYGPHVPLALRSPKNTTAAKSPDGAVTIPCTGLSVVAPDGFEPDPRPGASSLNDVKSSSGIFGYEASRPFSANRENIEKQALKLGRRVMSIESVTIDGFSGVLSYVVSQKEGTWKLEFGDEKKTAALIAYFPLSEEATLSPTLKKVLLGVKWQPPQIISFNKICP